jgi:hypothetical protein
MIEAVLSWILSIFSLPLTSGSSDPDKDWWDDEGKHQHGDRGWHY